MVELGNITGIILSSFSFEEAWSVLEPMVVFIIGMVIYSIFIFKFYREGSSTGMFLSYGFCLFGGYDCIASVE